MSNQLATVELGGDLLAFDNDLLQELTNDMAQGLGGGFKRAARLVMGNTGDWAVVDAEGNHTDIGREVNIVIVDQRKFVSRQHYATSFNESKNSEDEGSKRPDCYSTDGKAPDSDVENPYSPACNTCKVAEVNGNACSWYRRAVCVLVSPDGSFSDPVVFDIRSTSLFNKEVVNQQYMNYVSYIDMLKSNKRNGVSVPVPIQFVVTHCIPMPRSAVATVKFAIAANEHGGYWTLNKEQADYILQLKNSDEVQNLLKPFQAAADNPSKFGQIPVKNVEVEETKEEAPKPTPKPAPKKAPAPAPKPAPKPAVKKVVLGIEHPDVKNSPDFAYDDIVAWAKEADEVDVKAWLEDNFPQALEPVEVEEKQEAPTPKPAPQPAPKKAPAKKAEPAPEVEDNVVNTDGTSVDPELAKKAESLAQSLDDFDD